MTPADRTTWMSATGTRSPLSRSIVSRPRAGIGIALRNATLGIVALLGLQSCSLVPSSHYALTTLPFSSEQGWVQLPNRRWLLNPGISPDAMLFCPQENCGEQVFIARIELTGKETGFADKLIRDPVRLLASARPTHRSRHPQPVQRSDVSPLVIAGWAGAHISVKSRQARNATVQGNPAHVAIVAKREAERAWLMLAVARTHDIAIGRLKHALE